MFDFFFGARFFLPPKSGLTLRGTGLAFFGFYLGDIRLGEKNINQSQEQQPVGATCFITVESVYKATRDVIVLL